ncbi:MAG: NAD-dependent epimerase/dehydratase family protein [Puniceicoccaceae bacterium]
MSSGNDTILVTGATGFLGRRLCQRLQDQEGVHIRAVGRRRQDGPWQSFLEVDLAQDSLPSEALEGVSTIYHLASKAHAVSESASAASSYRPIIVDATRRLLELARKKEVQCFVYMSSVKAMGEGNPAGMNLAPLVEQSPHTPQGPYGLAKAEAEEAVLGSGIEHAVVLRPVMVYGPGEKGNLPRMVEAVRKGRFPPLPDTGNRRSMINVDDLVEFTMRASNYPIAAGKTYILAGDDAPSTRHLYDLIREANGFPPKSWSIPMFVLQAGAFVGSLLGSVIGKRLPLDRETLHKLTGSAWYSSSLAQAELRYKPRHSVDEWLKQSSSGPV